MEQHHPILLGVADKVLPLAGGNPALPMDIRGLRRVVFSWLYPLDVRNLVLVLYLPGGRPLRGKLEFATGSPSQSFWLDYKLAAEGPDGSLLEHLDYPVVAGFPLRNEHFPPSVWQPGPMTIFHERDGTRADLGHIDFDYHEHPPLTLDQSRAIESNPSLKRVIRLVVRCNNCASGITPYVALERPRLQASPEAPNPVWYKDLEGDFVCSCGQLKFPLKYLREGMIGLLLVGPLLADGSFASTSQIAVEDAEKVLTLFNRLLDQDPPEEEVQSFIEQHPLLLAPFAARHVFFKPPILNQRRADFGIVNALNELILIEIERPSLPLFTKEGIQRAELTQAFWQPQTWEQEVTNARPAVLRGIHGCPSDISRVRYLVVAGRSQAADDDAIARTVRASRECDFMTYDHLIEAVRNAVRAATG